MMIRKQSQQGLTTVGWILAIGLFGLIVITGFKILPMYIDYWNVKTVMEAVSKDENVDAGSKRDLWRAIEKRLSINSVWNLTKEDFKFSRENDTTTITADYEVRKPYLGDLFLGAHFTYSVEIKR